jgi:hydroxymethylbilane synthase
MEKIVIATRASRLALWQAEHVRDRLLARNAGCTVELLPLTTTGDALVDVSLEKAGGKGLFIKELEAAMQEGRADIAVHSMKDVPVELPPGFALAAILERDDCRDAFVSNKHATLASLPGGAILGTSSLRRAAQAAARHAGLEIRPLRGNVNTRLAKLDRGEYAGIVLAAAGLKRLGIASRIREYLPVEEFVPAAGQAALGIECLASRADLRAHLAGLEDEEASLLVRAERAVNRALGGSCTMPLGAHAELRGDGMFLRCVLALPDGSKAARAECTGPLDTPEALGERAAALLFDQGAAGILERLGHR